MIDFSIDDRPAVEHHDDIIVDRPRRRPGWPAVLAVVVAVSLVAGGGWWHRAVTAEPGLEFYGGPNVFRNPEGGDMGGIRHVDNLVGSEVDIDFVPAGRLFVRALKMS